MHSNNMFMKVMNVISGHKYLVVIKRGQRIIRRVLDFYSLLDSIVVIYLSAVLDVIAMIFYILTPT